ncbi:MAG: ABC transporter substrate-binding protein, partial [Candidatus Rokuibacteriota bacterium]
MKRREFVRIAGMGLAGSTVSHSLPALAQTGKSFTEWGWPQPYEPVSAASIKWLQGKGWWPIRFGSQPGFTSMPVAVPKGFFKARGLEFEVLPFLSGPAINEAAAASKIQGGLEGNFPFTSLIANDMPVRCLAILNPNVLHSTLVPPESPLKSIADLKGMSPTPAFGLVTGSSAEFYFNVALQVHGMVPGKDVILKNLRPPDMLIMPRGLTGVVQWSPWVWDQLYF